VVLLDFTVLITESNDLYLIVYLFFRNLQIFTTSENILTISVTEGRQIFTKGDSPHYLIEASSLNKLPFMTLYALNRGPRRSTLGDPSRCVVLI